MLLNRRIKIKTDQPLLLTEVLTADKFIDGVTKKNDHI